MDKRTLEALETLKQSKNYRDLCADTVARTFLEKAERHKSLKDADKAARAQLHAISGAFLSREEALRAEKALESWLKGEEEALNTILMMHASTRERMEIADELYSRIFRITGSDGPILDLACGLNPIYLASRGIRNITGMDIHSGCVRLINACAQHKGWSVRAETRDLLLQPPEGEYSLALMMKLLPVMETQRAGAAEALLKSVHARFIVASFPTRTLGGRGVGMEKHYSEWFEAMTGGEIRMIDRFTLKNELVYITERTDYASETLCGCHPDRESE